MTSLDLTLNDTADGLTVAITSAGSGELSGAVTETATAHAVATMILDFSGNGNHHVRERRGRPGTRLDHRHLTSLSKQTAGKGNALAGPTPAQSETPRVAAHVIVGAPPGGEMTGHGAELRFDGKIRDRRQQAELRALLKRSQRQYLPTINTHSLLNLK